MTGTNDDTTPGQCDLSRDNTVYEEESTESIVLGAWKKLIDNSAHC